LGSRAAVLLDAATGVILYSKNGNEEIPPASLTKLMTIHVVLTEAAARGISAEERWDLPRESWARNQPPRSSLMRIGPGQRANLRELLLGLAVPSGNDAAVAAALRFYPRVEEFTRRMNEEARRLGLVKTRFTEPSGISEYNITTAEEFALFCREYLRLHPETLESLHSVREFTYPTEANRESPSGGGGPTTHYNRNSLLGRVEGVDGLKTGYIDEAGYNIALTAERGGSRFIAVVLGAPAEYGGDRIRDADGERLLEWAFAHYKTLRPALPAIPPVRVWKGREAALDLVPASGPVCTVLAHRGSAPLRWEIEVRNPVIAPVTAAAPLGQLILSDREGELRRIPLLAASAVEQGGFFKRLWDTLVLFLTGMIRAAGPGNTP
jgi:D-alanyl-D-alanine carboxypeptidase (penicillin-binding protein 5/6)